jgi:TIGR02453 family protein
MSHIDPSTIQFLTDLRAHNNREWFGHNRDRYDLALANMKAMSKTITTHLNVHDTIEKSKLFRIYRDVRFSKDKTPYNSHWSMSWSREKPYLRGGYFLRIDPDGALMGCGFWRPSSRDLALIRGQIDHNAPAIKKVLKHSAIKKTFGQIQGAAVKTAPKGYSKEHPEIELLRMKQFIFYKTYTPKQTLQKRFVDQVARDFKTIRPFFDFMSEVLRYNLNGEELY